MVTYGTTAIPSDQITVLAGDTVSVSAAFENTIGLLGGMDVDNGTATTGEVTQVTSPSDAAAKFGDGSELHEQTQLAFQNGVGTVYALPVEETEATETIDGSGTLGNVPAMDPNVQPEHDIVDNNGNDVFISYDVDGETVDGTEAYVNPVTGDVNGDSGTTYDIQYTYGDYSTTAMQPLLDESPRIVTALTESVSVANDLASELNSRATNFDFMHGVAGASPLIDPSSFSSSVDERRLSLAYSSRGFIDAAETTQQRTAGAIGGYLASLPLGLSSTNDSIGGFTALLNPLDGPQDAGTLIDEGIMPLLDYPPVTIVKDMTTSTEPKFERVYAMQIADEATELSHLISREYVGGQNTSTSRLNLRRSHVNTFLGLETSTPRLLDDFTVSVEEDPNDDKAVIVTIGLDIVDVMDTVKVSVTVGDIVRGNTQE